MNARSSLYGLACPRQGQVAPGRPPLAHGERNGALTSSGTPTCSHCNMRVQTGRGMWWAPQRRSVPAVSAVAQDIGVGQAKSSSLGTDVRVRNISKTFVSSNGKEFRALSDCNVEIEAGELVALLGPSGSGKTTLMRIIAGLEDCTEGSIFFGDRDVTNVPVQQRNIGFCFQSYALFKHMTVAENIAFGPRIKGTWPENERDARVLELLELVQLPHLKDRYPAQLSGGQRQRVALARALALQPQLLLLDEPFGALDAVVRGQLREQTRELLKGMGITTVIVTHDQNEAFELADKVVVLNRGRIEQMGTPADLVCSPRTPFVANFIGPVSQVPSDSILARRMGFQTSKPLVLVRPGDVEIYPEPPKSLPSAAALVADRLIAGPTVIYELKFDDGVEIEVVVSRNEDPGIDVRQRVFVRVPPICLMGATADEISFAM